MADLLMNEGHLKDVTKKQKIEENKEKAEFLEAIPYIEHLVNWFDEQASECEKTTALDLEADEQRWKTDLLANHRLAELLRSKKGEFKAFLNTYAPKHAEKLEEDSAIDR